MQDFCNPHKEFYPKRFWKTKFYKNARFRRLDADEIAKERVYNIAKMRVQPRTSRPNGRGCTRAIFRVRCPKNRQERAKSEVHIPSLKLSKMRVQPRTSRPNGRGCTRAIFRVRCPKNRQERANSKVHIPSLKLSKMRVSLTPSHRFFGSADGCRQAKSRS